jgi:hypothetical protein
MTSGESRRPGATTPSSGRYRRVFSRWWTEPAAQSFSADQKVVALYLLSGPQTSSVGLYRLSPGEAAEDLHMDPRAFRGHLSVVCKTLGWTFDSEARVLWIPSWPTDNPPASLNAAKSWRKQLEEVPDCGTKTAAVNELRAYLATECSPAFLKVFGEALPEGMAFHTRRLTARNGDPSGIQEQDQDQDQEQEQETESGTAPDTGTEEIPPPPSASVPRVARASTGTDDPLFERFWQAYPKKVAKSAASKAFRSLTVDGSLLERMLEALEWQRLQPAWVKERGQFVPYPSTWLSKQQWEDEPFNTPDPTDAAWASVEEKISARRPS